MTSQRALGRSTELRGGKRVGIVEIAHVLGAARGAAGFTANPTQTGSVAH
jgi:hypothetical protein